MSNHNMPSWRSTIVLISISMAIFVALLMKIEIFHTTLSQPANGVIFFDDLIDLCAMLLFPTIFLCVFMIFDLVRVGLSRIRKMKLEISTIYYENSKHTHRYKIFLAIAILLAIIFHGFSARVVISRNGVFHKEFFTFSGEQYPWREIDSAAIFLMIEKDRNGRKLTPQFRIHAGDKSMSLWNSSGIGAVSNEKLMSAYSMLIKNQIPIHTQKKLSSEEFELLQQYSLEKKKMILEFLNNANEATNHPKSANNHFFGHNR